MTAAAPDPGSRWELYRLLADPVRPRLLALANHDEIAVGELAEALEASQPTISRHAAALRDAGLLLARKNGPWTLLRLAPGKLEDPVIKDAVRAGTEACESDGSLRRLDAIVLSRDAGAREFFARSGRPQRVGPPSELASYLAPFGALLPRRRLAVDVGTGDGAMLEVLAPIFEHVIAVDRSEVQLDLATARAARRGLGNVQFVRDEEAGQLVKRAVSKGSGNLGADAVFASRFLHHARSPARAMSSLVQLARRPKGGERGGAVVVLDYEAHDDQRMREAEADVWLGFSREELADFASDAGLADVRITPLPAAWRGDGPDHHLPWQLLVGFRDESPK